MITKIEALNYGCLRYISQPLEQFQILVGPNASGKSTFLDVLKFLGTFVSKGLEAAIEERTRNFQDLVWGREGDFFELAIEALIPENLPIEINTANQTRKIRYELSICYDKIKKIISINKERVLFGEEFNSDKNDNTIFVKIKNREFVIMERLRNNEIVFYGYDSSINPLRIEISSNYSILLNILITIRQARATSWLRDFLMKEIQLINLSDLALRQASPATQSQGIKADGSSLPWMVESLKNKSNERFNDWLGHIQTELTGLQDIRVVTREDDNHKYLMLKYASGVEMPSWMISDGTLRFLALTILAYHLPYPTGVFLIEEPENGIHPGALESLYQSLRSVYDAQVILATHSPIFLNLVKPENILCFTKTSEGQTNIIRGDEHPALQEWKGEVSLGFLLAGGVLG
jgi:predicted ATPase